MVALRASSNWLLQAVLLVLFAGCGKDSVLLTNAQETIGEGVMYGQGGPVAKFLFPPDGHKFFSSDSAVMSVVVYNMVMPAEGRAVVFVNGGEAFEFKEPPTAEGNSQAQGKLPGLRDGVYTLSVAAYAPAHLVNSNGWQPIDERDAVLPQGTIQALKHDEVIVAVAEISFQIANSDHYIPGQDLFSCQPVLPSKCNSNEDSSFSDSSRHCVNGKCVHGVCRCSLGFGGATCQTQLDSVPEFPGFDESSKCAQIDEFVSAQANWSGIFSATLGLHDTGIGPVDQSRRKTGDANQSSNLDSSSEIYGSKLSMDVSGRAFGAQINLMLAALAYAVRLNSSISFQGSLISRAPEYFSSFDDSPCESPTVLQDSVLRPSDFMDPSDDFSFEQLPAVNVIPWRILATGILLQSSRFAQNQVDFFWNALAVQSPAVAVHVRRGDSCHHAKREPGSRPECFEWETYIDAASALCDIISCRSVLLLSDAQPPAGLSMKGGQPIISRSSTIELYQSNAFIEERTERGLVAAHDVVAHTIVDIKLAAKCSAFVGTFTSHMSRLMFSEMWHASGFCPPFVSIDANNFKFHSIEDYKEHAP